MFDRFVGARTEKRGKSKALMFGASTLAHVAAVGALLAWSFWKVEKLAARRVPVTFVSATAPPPPPPPAPAPPAPAKVVAKPKVVAKNELVQPVPDPDPDPDPEPNAGEPTVGPTDPKATAPGGVPGGPGEGRCGEPGEPECPPPVVERPKVVSLQAVEAARLSGNADIALPPEVKQAVYAEGKREVLAMAKLCLGRDGVPTEVSIKKSSGYPAADARIRDEMLRWRYRPYKVNNEAFAVCTSIMFRYQIL